uniref:Uncharacterized protein n=1 Tax=Glossina palpalis gambiensis TaxID=67801 RepID=A0A1B0C1X5_9MUSC
MDSRHTRFVSARLAVPLFMISKNALENETVTMRHFQRCLNEFYSKPFSQCVQPSPPKGDWRSLTVYKPWQMAPNRYDTLKEMYASFKGSGGAYWKKLSKGKPRPRTNEGKAQFKFYNIPTETDHLWSKAQKHKGVMGGNARQRKATSRIMISNMSGCYRNPDEPAPNSYHTPMKWEKEIFQTWEKQNPHLFCRFSSAPAKINSCHPRHVSFNPAPGRYEIRYQKVCACSPNLIYQPEIQLLIDREKRNKFRRLPYVKIKARLYCSPDWRHVPGRGFRHLFKGAPPRASKKTTTKKLAKRDIKVNYADAKYIHSLSDPSRRLISLRSEPLPQIPPRIEFNTLRKPIIRKTLRINKKIVFGSGQPRFKEEKRLVQTLTIAQLEALKETLPLERQLRDHPIMSKAPEEIASKLYVITRKGPEIEIPKSLKDFKFSPLPDPKILVTREDIHVERSSLLGHFLQRPKPEAFFFTKEEKEAIAAKAAAAE